LGGASLCPGGARSRPEYLARLQNPDLAHLHVEIAVAQGGLDTYGSSTAPRALVFGPKASKPLSNACQRCFPWKQLLQSAGAQVRLEPNKDIDVGIEARASMTLEHAWRHRINSKTDSERFPQLK
jgi:hypothetical protein